MKMLKQNISANISSSRGEEEAKNGQRREKGRIDGDICLLLFGQMQETEIGNLVGRPR